MEWLGLKPSWAEEIGMWGVMFCRTNFSSILEGIDRSYIGLYEVCSVGGLLCSKWGQSWLVSMMFESCVLIENINMSMRAPTACVTKGFM